MKVETLLTPRDVRIDQIVGRAVVVFDVLRATTTMTAALAAGVVEIRIFDSLDDASAASRAFGQPHILCGERNCLPPPGFDLGNSPGAFRSDLHAGKTAFMATTNGTRAIVAARSAKLLFAGALVNASAVAQRLIESKLNVSLLCAGTAGEPAMEDLLGAGAVIAGLSRLLPVTLENDVSKLALRLFQCSRNDLVSVMKESTGGKNVIDVGLEADIAFAAQLDAMNVVGKISDSPLRLNVAAVL
jgi:2-phosphosulfolactate phosphatase